MGYVSLRIRSLGIRSLCIQSVDRKLFLPSAIFLTTMQYAGVLPKEIINQLTEASSKNRVSAITSQQESTSKSLKNLL